MKKLLHLDLGHQEYIPTWDFQLAVQAKIIQEKRAEQKENRLEDVLLFVEHPHVYTLGKSGDAGNLLASEDFLKAVNATYVPIDRGGDITYHGPGQLVGYPILEIGRAHV